MTGFTHSISVYHLDDNFIDLQRVQAILSKGILGYQFIVRGVQTSAQFWQEWYEAPVELVLLDINLNEERQGLSLIADIRARANDVVIVLYSSLAETATISAGLQLGVDDFLTKGCAADEMRLRLVNSFSGRRRSRFSPLSPEIVGETMRKINNQLLQVDDSAVSAVHVCGESGTGKEMVAKIIQASIGPRTMVEINCAAIVPSLMASELFGHCRGAFSGANNDRVGYLEQASGGWVFFDEVACLSEEMQAALLRVLENGEVVRVGESNPRRVEFKILSASNESLAELVDQGKFRLDLWQRLRELEVALPPLRERRAEIPLLIDHFLKTMRGGPYSITREARQILQQQDWRDGNIRELRNCLRSMSAYHVNGLLAPTAIPERFWCSSDQQTTTVSLNNFFVNQPPLSFAELLPRLTLACLQEHHRQYGRTSLTTFAKNFQLHPSTASRKIKQLLEVDLLPNEQLQQYITSDLKKDA